jgi:hypothetical protein
MKDTDVLRHKDVFKYQVMPQMQSMREGWDNMSEQEEHDIDSVEHCREACERLPACKQFSYDREGRCKTRNVPRLGTPSVGTTSGWIQDRIAAFERDMAPCGSEGLDTLPGDL